MIAGRQQFGPYQILGRLGAGAMGEVYRAHDPRLRRDVAIKILPPHRSDDPEALARMVRESRTVAALEHAAIVTIHDVGEEAGQFYFVTELLEGETLRDRLRRGPLRLHDALDFAVTIASALAAAHARGVVHRDLKPENIMSTASGVLKVLDFGVAKFVASPDSATAPPATIVTEAGAIIGTPAYMAPEQLEGRSADHRSDQFALGVIVFEMLAGRRPFQGVTAPEVTASILRDEPTHLSAERPDVPPAIARIVTRCLAKDPNQRYASTLDLEHALTDARADLAVARTPPAGAAAVGGRRFLWAAAAAVVVFLAIAGSVGWPRKQSPTPASAGVPGARAVAVLPFTVIGDADTYLADGLTEAVTRQLGHIDGTRVIASSSAFAYRGRTEGFSQIARELGVEMMVRGSIQRAGERLQISAALVNANDDTTLWTNSYNRGMGDVLAVQDDIAWQVAAKLATMLGAAAPPRPTDTPKTSPDAYDAYLRGLSSMRAGSAHFAEGIPELERAVALDPSFALGRARLASAYTQQFFYNASDPALEKKAFLEIEKAVMLNPDLAEAYLARAQLVWNLRNGFPHGRAIADLRRAIENNPNLAEAHVELGKVYYHIGLIDQSIAANQEALRLDPLARAAASRMFAARIDGRRVQEVADELARNPRQLAGSIPIALMFLGRTDEAIATLTPRGVTPESLLGREIGEVAMLAQAYARKGWRGESERALAIAIPLAGNPTGLSDTHHTQFTIGCTYALLGDSNKAVEWLTKAANEGYPSYPRFSSDPDLAGLKGHVGFESLLARLRSDHERWRKTLT